MIYCSPNLDQTRLGLAIGIPLGVVLLLGLIVFVIVRRHRGRQSGFVPGFHDIPISQYQHLPGSSKRFVLPVATAPTAPTPFTAYKTPLVSSVAPSSPPQLVDTGTEDLDASQPQDALSRVSAPPPYIVSESYGNGVTDIEPLFITP